MISTMQGVRVLEVAAWTYVPAAGAVLAEWGADVIKIEHPETGDPQRGLVNSGLIPTGPGGVSHMIELPNRGKRSVGLDLKTEGGREALLRIAAESDVFLTSYLPHVRESLRIDVDDIRAANPNIIYVRGSGQGQHGDERDKGGFDGATFWGRVVANIATPGSLDRPVGPPGPAFGDMLGGMTIAGGISAALFHRERTGEALVVDSSLMSTAMWAASATLMAASLFGIDALPKMTRYDVPNPLVGDYETEDGRFLSLVMLQADRMWPDLMPKIGHPEMLTDPRFATPEARRRTPTGGHGHAGHDLRVQAARRMEGDPPRRRGCVGADLHARRGHEGSSGNRQRLCGRRRGGGRFAVQDGAVTDPVRRGGAPGHQGARPRPAHRRRPRRVRLLGGADPRAEDQRGRPVMGVL